MSFSIDTSENEHCIILGGGGHASVLIDIIKANKIARPYAILDNDSSRWGGDLLGVPILGDDDLLSELTTKGIRYFLVGLGSTDDNKPRRRLYELGLSHRLKPLTVKAPNAFCSPYAQVGPGCQLLPAAVVNARADIGENVIINSGAIIEHDCILGNHVHVATGARLASTVRVGTGAHIGVGATVRQLISIGEGAVVGAGAAVERAPPPLINYVRGLCG